MHCIMSIRSTVDIVLYEYHALYINASCLSAVLLIAMIPHNTHEVTHTVLSVKRNGSNPNS